MLTHVGGGILNDAEAYIMVTGTNDRHEEDMEISEWKLLGN